MLTIIIASYLFFDEASMMIRSLDCARISHVNEVSACAMHAVSGFGARRGEGKKMAARAAEGIGRMGEA